MLVLPHGYVYGRVQAHAVKEILHSARENRIVVEDCRGNSAWERPGQAAELALRSALGEDTAQALTVVLTEGVAPRWEVTLAHRDGRRWRVTVVRGRRRHPGRRAAGRRCWARRRGWRSPRCAPCR
ncbi:Sucrase ferredoxin OS=Streptomyces tendae OX=1932 GN=GUR47_34870 PE=4 SV=1 [Streptomyces tendae]